jgi:hypothetical protein
MVSGVVSEAALGSTTARDDVDDGDDSCVAFVADKLILVVLAVTERQRLLSVLWMGGRADNGRCLLDKEGWAGW